MTINSITLIKVTKKSPIHPLQNKYKKKRKPKRWWIRTSKIQSFRSSHKKYKPTKLNILSLLPELLPNILDFTVGTKKFHQNNFNKCIYQLKRTIIIKKTQRQRKSHTLIDYYRIDSNYIDLCFLIGFYNIKLIVIHSKQLYPNHLFKNIHYSHLKKK